MSLLTTLRTWFAASPLIADTAQGPFRLAPAPTRRLRCHTLQGAPPITARRLPAVHITTHKARLTALLARRDYPRADAYYRLVRHCFAHPAYAVLRRHYWQQHRDEVLAALATYLDGFDFLNADALAARSTLVVAPPEYTALKAKAVQRFFSDRYSFGVNDEQAAALAAPADHVLVKARAGTGKTRTIVAKAVLSLYEYDLHPDQVLMLAFNRDAANEMLDRMRESFNLPEFSTAKTFHSLAYRLVNPIKTLQAEDEIKRELVEQAMQSVWTPAFRRLVNHFFRIAEDADILAQQQMDNAEHYAYRRDGIKHLSLGGARVKSTGEKWIADFLFEHGIRFDYEFVYRWNGEPYRPDFTLSGPPPTYTKLAVIEHWGVSANDPDHLKPFADGKTVGAYRRERARKRQFWANRRETLVETSLDDMRHGREAFEARLKAKLEAAGIPCERLPATELEQKVKRTYWNALTGQMLQFIQRAKNRRMPPAETRRLWRTMPRGGTRMRLFWGLAARVYAAYEELLVAQNQMDFQDLLAAAADRIDAEQGNLAFIPERGKLPVRLPDLRIVLIDEYQDFSPGFDHLITTMRKHNPHLRLFCVGDDWQTINRFAGSEPHFFRAFTQRLDQAAESLLKINHRSQRAIVDTSNRLMHGHGTPGTWLPHHRAGAVYALCIDQLWLDTIAPTTNGNNGGDNGSDPDTNATPQDVTDQDAEPTTRKFDPGFMRARCLAACQNILEHSLKPGHTAAILSRTRWIHGLHYLDFAAELLASLPPWLPDQAEIQVSTIHKYKGLEADLVILADITAGQVPLLHQDTELYAPFLEPGADPIAEALIDERRLFYVALSRATHHLYILTETGRHSPFLQALNVPLITPRHLTTPAGPGVQAPSGPQAGVPYR